VQEIGRAGRAEEKVTSYVVYRNSIDNDYAQACRKLNGGTETSADLYDRLLEVYTGFHSGQKTAYLVDQPIENIASYKQLVYMLYVTGYVKDWYAYRAIDGGETVELIVDICSVPNAGGHKVAVLDDASMLERMRKKSRDYFAAMGNDRRSIFRVSKAQKIEEILKVYVDWYYEKFLYRRKEQFLDFFEFLKTGA
jgi:hypothetical protein